MKTPVAGINREEGDTRITTAMMLIIIWMFPYVGGVLAFLLHKTRGAK